jgi:hypothetical protein
MQEPTHNDAQRSRAEELREQVEELRRGAGESAPTSPRDFTDRAADEARERD